MIVGGGLALMAWYARILIEHADVLIYHIFFSMEENLYHITAVGPDNLLKNFGVTLFLASVGIPLAFFLVKKKKALKSSILIIFWFAVPFFLSQLYFFGVLLPYHRFVYFFATPIAILAGVTAYYIIKTARTLIESKVIPKLAKRINTVTATKIFTVALVFCLFFVQAFLFLQLIPEYPQFYERGPIASYESGIWVKQHSVPDGIVVTTRSPGSWFYVFSDHNTTQETDPLYSRSIAAEAILYSFHEIENSVTLTREYDPVSPSSGQAIYVSLFNIWTKALTIPNDQINVAYVDSLGESMTVSLSETDENIYWKQNSTDKAQLVSEYSHEHFTAKRTVTFSSTRSAINIEWTIKAHQKLSFLTLSISNYFEFSLDFDEALVPGVLEWQNPWDNATYINAHEKWAVIEGQDMLSEKLVAVLDAQHGILTAYQFDEEPDGFSLGALNNHFIDAMRLQYDLGDVAQGRTTEVSFSLLAYAFELEEIERRTTLQLKQQFVSKKNQTIQARDFRAYIEEQNIKFVVVDTQQIVSNIEATPALDKIYDNGRVIVYTTKR